MKTDTPQTIYLKDYTAPAYLVDTVDLDINIEAGTTTVTATLPCAATRMWQRSRWCSTARSLKP
jgi:aminopeptidase N